MAYNSCAAFHQKKRCTPFYGPLSKQSSCSIISWGNIPKIFEQATIFRQSPIHFLPCRCRYSPASSSHPREGAAWNRTSFPFGLSRHLQGNCIMSNNAWPENRSAGIWWFQRTLLTITNKSMRLYPHLSQIRESNPALRFTKPPLHLGANLAYSTAPREDSNFRPPIVYFPTDALAI